MISTNEPATKSKLAIHCKKLMKTKICFFLLNLKVKHKVSSSVKVRFKIRFYDIVAVPAVPAELPPVHKSSQKCQPVYSHSTERVRAFYSTSRINIKHTGKTFQVHYLNSPCKTYKLQVAQWLECLVSN